MTQRRKREPKDWRESIEDHPHQETAAEEMASLVHPGIRSRAYAGLSVFGLISNDIDAEVTGVQRCPKCGHHSLSRLRRQDKQSPGDSNWRCTRCGNDTDEFGNKL
jgi:predicted RNA-binding Zn-ribbon protein involved in translation (DUF1610 family)